MKRIFTGAIRHPLQKLEQLAEQKVADEPLMQELESQTAAAEVATEKTEQQIRRKRKRRRQPLPKAIADALANGQPDRET